MGPAKAALDYLYGRGQFMPPAGMSPEEMSSKLADRIGYAQATGRLRKSDG
jgi:hypothetical protein